MTKTSPREWGLVSAAAALVADQGSKFALLYGFGFLHMAPGQAVRLLPFFNLVMVWNPGISYGLFPASSLWGTVLLVLISLAAVVGLGYWLWGMTSLFPGDRRGAGDRRGHREQSDRPGGLWPGGGTFLLSRHLGYGFYVFNVADIAIAPLARWQSSMKCSSFTSRRWRGFLERLE